MSHKFLGNHQIIIANWHQDKENLHGIRKKVFIEEQHVPEALEWDEHDDSATHFMVTLNNKAIATARLKHDGQIGRMAVLREFRHKNIGSQLLNFILLTANNKKINSIFLHAQVQVIDFYKKHNFTEEGEIFLDANILHQKMIQAR